MSEPITDKTNTPPPSRSGSGQHVAFSIILVIVILLFTVSSVFFHPLRNYETTLYLTIVTCPLWLLMAVTLNKKIIEYIPVGTNQKSKAPPIKFVIYLGSLLMTLGAVYTLNSKLDESPEQICEGAVINKYVSHGRHSTSYHAEIPTCTEGKISFITLDTTEDISVSRTQYDNIQLNVTRGTIIYKSGRYHIPWKVSAHIITEYNNPVVAPYLVPFSAASHDPDYQLGVAYFTGKGQIKDDVRAVEAFKIAVSRGNAMAEHDLAYMEMNGLGTAKDPQAAAQLIWQSAQQGYALAQDYLGVMFGDGINGLPQDWVQSFVWINRAAKQGYDQAIKDLVYARQHMTPQQVEQAQQESNLPASSSIIH